KILLPQAVRCPARHKTSFTAIGMPASGPSGSPRFRRTSTERACSRAPGSSTCRKACTLGSQSRIACKYWLVRLSEVSSPRLRRERYSTAVRSAMSHSALQIWYSPMGAGASLGRERSIARILLQHSRDAVKIAAAVGSVGQRLGNRQRGRRFVFTEDILDRQRMGQRFDGIGVDLLELLE